jgi:predicted transcriptional regulator
LIAKELIEKHHFTQTLAAEKLGTTQAAISHYLSSKRGEKYVNILTENSQAMSTITNLVDRIAMNVTTPNEVMETFCELCGLVQEQNLVIG